MIDNSGQWWLRPFDKNKFDPSRPVHTQLRIESYSRFRRYSAAYRVEHTKAGYAARQKWCWTYNGALRWAQRGVDKAEQALREAAEA